MEQSEIKMSKIKIEKLDDKFGALWVPPELLEPLKPVIKFIQGHGVFTEGQVLVEFVEYSDGKIEIQAHFLNPNLHLEIAEGVAEA